MRTIISQLAIVSAAVACAGNEPSEDPRCQQTYEFGNTGCGELRGLVTDGAGSPLAGAYVDSRNPAEPGRHDELAAGYVRTDSTGNYEFRVVRYSGEVPAEGPDTVTVWVHAGMPPPDDAPIGTSGPRDSVLALLELRPVGEAPVVKDVVTIMLGVP
jgi:hypothetical protein